MAEENSKSANNDAGEPQEGLEHYINELSKDDALDQGYVELLGKAVAEKTDGPVIAERIISLIGKKYAEAQKD